MADTGQIVGFLTDTRTADERGWSPCHVNEWNIFRIVHMPCRIFFGTQVAVTCYAGFTSKIPCSTLGFVSRRESGDMATVDFNLPPSSSCEYVQVEYITAQHK